MQSLYYYSSSLTGSNLYLIPNNDDYTQYEVYDVTNLIVCSSLYQILVYSGSSLLFSAPIENTNLYYLPSTESAFPPTPITYINPDVAFGVPPPTASVPSSSFNYVFTPDIDVVSSNNKLIITGSSINIIQSQSSAFGFFQIGSGSAINIIVSGSGNFYNSDILIYNNNLLITSSYTSSLNTPLLTTFIPSFEGYTYSIFTKTTTIPSIELTYNSSSNIPVSPTSSLENWNSYLSISASSIINTGSSVYLLNGNINALTSSILTGTGSEYLTNINIIGANDLMFFALSTGSLTSFPTFQGTPNLQYITINNASLTSSNLPTDLTALSYYDVCNNKISGSITSIIQNASQSISLLSCSFNNLTGSIPALSNFPPLSYLDCSNNQLSGSIVSFSGSYGLSYFNCSNNALTGSLPSLENCISLYYFDCSNNKLTGSIPSFASSSLLQHFDVSNNQLSGSFIYLLDNTQLTYIDYSNNQISDINAIYVKVLDIVNIPPLVEYYDCSYNFLNGTLNLSGSSNLVTFIANNNQFLGTLKEGESGASSLLGCTNLQTFNVSDNYLTGSIPDLSNNTALVAFSIANNQISGDIPNIDNNVALSIFNVSDNYLTGSVPVLGNNVNLTTFIAKNNQITFFPDPEAVGNVPSSLTYIDLENNNLNVSNIFRLAGSFWGTFSGSLIPGYLNVSGSGNASVTGSPLAISYFNDLTASGWTIYANDYP